MVSAPVAAVQAAVLHRFCQVLGSDRLGVIEIGDGAGDFEDAVMCASAQAHAADGHLERSLTCVVESAELPQEARRNASIIETAALLDDAGILHTSPHIGGTHAVILAAKFLISHGRDLDVKIDAIEQRSAYFTQIALNNCAGAAAFVRRV